MEEAAADAEMAAMVLTMDTILQWVGFDNVATRNRLREEGISSFEAIRNLDEKAVTQIEDSFGRRSVADGRAIFGAGRTGLLIGLVHWVLDQDRLSKKPSLDEFQGDAVLFRAALTASAKRDKVRKVEKDQSDTMSKAANPGKFKDEKKWAEWEPAFCNYLSTIPGVSGVPLSYVVREKEIPDDDEVEYDTFDEEATARAPLTGSAFQADARKVHQLVKSFLQDETAEQWIKPIEKKRNGRQDMIVLRSHYSGEGNTSRRIAMAERIRDSLHYKNERAMPFSSFLDKMQKMFNIFEEMGEPLQEQAKYRNSLSSNRPPGRSPASTQRADRKTSSASAVAVLLLMVASATGFTCPMAASGQVFTPTGRTCPRRIVRL
jgi:hypothetical protein